MTKMFLTMLNLNPKHIKDEKITDDYSIHRVVFSIFDDVRTGTADSYNESSGILYADKGGDHGIRKILILSNRLPNSRLQDCTQTKEISENFFNFSSYHFTITVNPVKRDSKSGKLIPLKTEEKVTEWFLKKASDCGFTTKQDGMDIRINNTKTFTKKNCDVLFNSATISGILEVTDREKFIKCITTGIGKGKAFGFGLLEVVPIKS